MFQLKPFVCLGSALSLSLAGGFAAGVPRICLAGDEILVAPGTYAPIPVATSGDGSGGVAACHDENLAPAACDEAEEAPVVISADEILEVPASEQSGDASETGVAFSSSNPGSPVADVGEDGLPAVTEADAADNPLGADLAALEDGRLDQVRGGFESDQLKVSFGIDRTVSVNGNLVASTSLNVADIGRLSGGQPAVEMPGGSNLALVQIGPGNLLASGTLPATSIGTVIQNTLDNQQIRTETTINATVNSLQLLRSIDLQFSMRDALGNALRR